MQVQGALSGLVGTRPHLGAAWTPGPVTFSCHFWAPSRRADGLVQAWQPQVLLCSEGQHMNDAFLPNLHLPLGGMRPRLLVVASFMSLQWVSSLGPESAREMVALPHARRSPSCSHACL